MVERWTPDLKGEEKMKTYASKGRGLKPHGLPHLRVLRQRKGLSLAARKEPKQPLRAGKRRLALRKYKFPGTTNACALRRIHDRALRYARLNPQPRLAFCGPGCVALAHHDYPVQWCDSSSR